MPHPDVHEANFPNMLVATGSSRSLDLLMLVLACGPTSGRSSSCLRCCRVPGAGCWSPRSGAGAGSAVERIHLGLVLVVLVPAVGAVGAVGVVGVDGAGQRSASGWLRQIQTIVRNNVRGERFCVSRRKTWHPATTRLLPSG